MRSSSYLLSLSVALLLGACSQPNFTPSFHAYHTDEYKAPPGKTADSLGYDYTPDRNAETLMMWQAVASDLADHLDGGLLVSGQDIYLVPHPSRDAFINSYDYFLREELGKRGYHILGTYKEGATPIFFEAMALEHQEPHELQDTYNGDPTFEFGDVDAQTEEEKFVRDIVFRVVVGVPVKGSILPSIVRVHRMPIYGYKGVYSARYLQEQIGAMGVVPEHALTFDVFRDEDRAPEENE